MGWRFRKSFKVIPGLRLNLSRSGLSASIGGAPFTLNVGPHGVMGTGSIPGTGISYREHFGSVSRTVVSHDPSSSPSENEIQPAFPGSATPYVPPAPPLTPSSTHMEEIRSASTELLTSESLKELKKLMLMTFEEHEAISQDLDLAKTEKERAVNRYGSWESGFLLKRLFKGTFARRKLESETATAKVAELEEQLRLTTITTHVEMEREQAEPYFRMRDDFAMLCESAAIWDIKSYRATDKLHERTIAARLVDRQRVAFSLDSCDLIQWEQRIPHIRNANGGDLYLYPGFILYRATKEAFSVINYHELTPNVRPVSFNEQEGVPADSKIIGQTWAKANKDGSRDRRFAGNYQIPIALYGSLTLKSKSGLLEEFQFSDPERLLKFMKSLGAFLASFGHAVPSAPRSVA